MEALSKTKQETPYKKSRKTEIPERKIKKKFFPLKSSLTALWLPAVVGDQSCVFMTTVISTHVTKILVLILAAALAFSGQQQSVFSHPFILWCEEDWESDFVGNLTLCSFQKSSNLTPCFDNSIGGVQKLRVCSTEEETFSLFSDMLQITIHKEFLLWLEPTKQ